MFVLIISLLFSLFVAIFALQNSTPVDVNFFWTVQKVPLVLVILGSVFAGAFITLLFALWREYRNKRRRLKKEAEFKKQEELKREQDAALVDEPVVVAEVEVLEESGQEEKRG